MDIADFKTELARLIEKGATAGLSIDDMADELTEAADELTEAAEDLPSFTRSEQDSVGGVIASHRPKAALMTPRALRLQEADGHAVPKWDRVAKPIIRDPQPLRRA